MKKLLCLVLAVCMSTTAFANCPKPVTSLEQGAQAPCSGFLFSKEKEQEVRLMAEDYKLVQEELNIKNKKLELTLKDLRLSDEIILKERDKTELWRLTAEKSTLELVKVNESQGNRDLLMILLGVVVTVGAGYAVGQASK
jgi:hypothetical protein